jgi:DNA-binding NarL/FixJ family response regulator
VISLRVASGWHAGGEGPAYLRREVHSRVWTVNEHASLTEGEVDPLAEHEPRPPEEELIVLRLVVDGLTDHAIAHKLGISVITVRRRIRSLRDRVGAPTRLKAAVIAARRGWL